MNEPQAPQAQQTIGSDSTVKQYIFTFMQQAEQPAKVAAAVLTHYRGDAHDAESLLWEMWGKLAGPFTAENGGVRPNAKSPACQWLQECILAIVDGRELPSVPRSSRFDVARHAREQALTATADKNLAADTVVAAIG